jgi:hypothetical protein
VQSVRGSIPGIVCADMALLVYMVISRKGNLDNLDGIGRRASSSPGGSQDVGALHLVNDFPLTINLDRK